MSEESTRPLNGNQDPNDGGDNSNRRNANGSGPSTEPATGACKRFSQWYLISNIIAFYRWLTHHLSRLQCTCGESQNSSSGVERDPTSGETSCGISLIPIDTQSLQVGSPPDVETPPATASGVSSIPRDSPTNSSGTFPRTNTITSTSSGTIPRTNTITSTSSGTIPRTNTITRTSDEVADHSANVTESEVDRCWNRTRHRRPQLHSDHTDTDRSNTVSGLPTDPAEPSTSRAHQSPPLSPALSGSSGVQPVEVLPDVPLAPLWQEPVDPPRQISIEEYRKTNRAHRTNQSGSENSQNNSVGGREISQVDSLDSPQGVQAQIHQIKASVHRAQSSSKDSNSSSVERVTSEEDRSQSEESLSNLTETDTRPDTKEAWGWHDQQPNPNLTVESASSTSTSEVIHLSPAGTAASSITEELAAPAGPSLSPQAFKPSQQRKESNDSSSDFPLIDDSPSSPPNEGAGFPEIQVTPAPEASKSSVSSSEPTQSQTSASKTSQIDETSSESSLEKTQSATPVPSVSQSAKLSDLEIRTSQFLNILESLNTGSTSSEHISSDSTSFGSSLPKDPSSDLSVPSRGSTSRSLSGSTSQLGIKDSHTPRKQKAKDTTDYDVSSGILDQDVDSERLVSELSSLSEDSSTDKKKLAEEKLKQQGESSDSNKTEEFLTSERSTSEADPNNRQSSQDDNNTEVESDPLIHPSTEETLTSERNLSESDRGNVEPSQDDSTGSSDPLIPPETSSGAIPKEKGPRKKGSKRKN